jgi:hypothetical protein
MAKRVARFELADCCPAAPLESTTVLKATISTTPKFKNLSFVTAAPCRNYGIDLRKDRPPSRQVLQEERGHK